jgi:hypothetical protein
MQTVTKLTSTAQLTMGTVVRHRKTTRSCEIVERTVLSPIIGNVICLSHDTSGPIERGCWFELNFLLNNGSLIVGEEIETISSSQALIHLHRGGVVKILGSRNGKNKKYVGCEISYSKWSGCLCYKSSMTEWDPVVLDFHSTTTVWEVV